MPGNSVGMTIAKLANGLNEYSEGQLVSRIKSSINSKPSINGEVKLLVKNKTRQNLRSVMEIYYMTGEDHPYDNISKILKIRKKSAYEVGKEIGSWISLAINK